MSQPPDQWHQMNTSGGVLKILVSIAGNYGTIVFSGQDLIDLKEHVELAVAQLAVASGGRAQ